MERITSYEYKIIDHGDWLEKQAAVFISSNIPAYELIWQSFIGHQGNGVIAQMNNISEEDEKKRRNFSQHHYTILESLYFMQLLVDDESKTHQIMSFNDYRKVINQIMAYQAYSGRLRDNMEKCYSLITKNDNVVKEACNKLDTFYYQRHVFMHGKKVPFAIDSDKLFKIPQIKKYTLSRIGYGLEMQWESISEADMVNMEEALKESIFELKPLVQSLLSNLFSYVKKHISSKELSLKPPTQFQNEKTGVSGWPESSGTIKSISGYSISKKHFE